MTTKALVFLIFGIAITTSCFSQEQKNAIAGTKNDTTSFVITSNASEFIILEQDVNSVIRWRITDAKGRNASAGSIPVDSEDFLQELFRDVQAAKTSKLDRNPKVSVGKHMLLFFHRGSVAVTPLSIARQETLVMSQCFKQIRELPYMDGHGGGTGAFYQMTQRFLGPLRTTRSDPDPTDHQGTAPTGRQLQQSRK